MLSLLLSPVGPSRIMGRAHQPAQSSCVLHLYHKAPAPTTPAVQRAMAPTICAASRPAAGPSVIICSSLRKERKKLAKVLKSHRKVLERRLSALTASEVDSPVLSELLTELRTLTCRLEEQRAAGMVAARDSSDSSDSDEDDCPARPADSVGPAQRGGACCGSSSSGGVCGSRRTALAAVDAAAPAAPTPPASSSTLIVSGLSGQHELSVPELEEGWDWSEEEFRSAKFAGAGGRVMVCTGGKCQRRGGSEVLRAVSALCEGNPAIEVLPCKCLGKCGAGAAVRVRPAGQPCATYTRVRPAQLRDVFGEHFEQQQQRGQQQQQRGQAVADPAASPVTCCDDCMRS